MMRPRPRTLRTNSIVKSVVNSSSVLAGSWMEGVEGEHDNNSRTRQAQCEEGCVGKGVVEGTLQHCAMIELAMAPCCCQWIPAGSRRGPG